MAFQSLDFWRQGCLLWVWVGGYCGVIFTGKTELGEIYCYLWNIPNISAFSRGSHVDQSAPTMCFNFSGTLERFHEELHTHTRGIGGISFCWQLAMALKTEEAAKKINFYYSFHFSLGTHFLLRILLNTGHC